MENPSDIRKKVVDANQVLKECEQVEGEMAALHAAYEQFFLGIERQPPTRQHTALKKRIVSMQQSFVRQTSTKFRVAALQNRFLSYERMWNRTLQEMENGTYRRDLFKARLKAQAQAPAPEAKTQEPAPVAQAPKASAPPAAASPVSEEKLRAVYEAYVTAKKRCNEDVSKLTYESMANTLKKQVPELLKQHKAQGVDFKVVIKDGKAVLRAIPK